MGNREYYSMNVVVQDTRMMTRYEVAGHLTLKSPGQWQITAHLTQNNDQRTLGGTVIKSQGAPLKNAAGWVRQAALAEIDKRASRQPVKGKLILRGKFGWR